jgi:hypothetical protein
LLAAGRDFSRRALLPAVTSGRAASERVAHCAIASPSGAIQAAQ